jgi:hypothetical protein
LGDRRRPIPAGRCQKSMFANAPPNIGGRH